MWEKESLLLQDRNPKTEAAHRKQVLWQVTLPLILGIIVILALAVLATLARGGTQHLWGDIALIWLILPMLVLLIVFTGIFAGLAYLFIRLNNAVPRLALKAHHLVKGVQASLTRAADRIAQPVIKVEGWRATLKAIFGR
jgi:hypothetical protein